MVVIWMSLAHERVVVSPLGVQGSFHENQRVLFSHTALNTRLSLVARLTLVPGCRALGGIVLFAIEKVLLVILTVPGGVPLTVTKRALDVLLLLSETHASKQFVTK